MKTITIVIPTYNEEENVELIYKRVVSIFQDKLNQYQYKILFVDNCSNDRTRELIRNLSNADCNVQYIFYVRNFGFSKSTFYGLTQAEGDCAILLFADMQDPPEVMIDFVEEWEKGNKVVAGIKNKSQENRLIYFIRNCYYKFIKKITDIPHIEQFTGFGLYDRTVINILKKLEDPLPYLRGIIAELTPECKKVFYEQKKREHGRSSFRFIHLYDIAMLGITSYSKSSMHAATFLGGFISFISFLLAALTFVLKIFKIIDYPIGTAAILFGVFFLGGIQLVFIGILGEYISNINIRTMKHPIVVEEERGNLEKTDKM